ncbi:unnamed protein product [Paramecium primaurelia]|uniref:Uncharacterized protein n=1 Tax=Paramecium primaurelia TaxID=5886 RepID=A0A8S1JSI4_PARPR|nr:unnamed protein product [Paramecium primaurelia]
MIWKQDQKFIDICQYLPSNLFNLQWVLQRLNVYHISTIQAQKEENNKIKGTLLEDHRISQSDQRYFPLIFQLDEFYPKNMDLINENFNGISFIGRDALFVRIRITFIYSISNIQAILKSYKIIKYNLEQQNNHLHSRLKIFEKNQTCYGNAYTLLRIERLFNFLIPIQIFQLKDKFNIKMNLGIQKFHFRRRILLRKLFNLISIIQKQKVQSCRIYSTNCIDYEDMIPYLRYLAQGFYDLIQLLIRLNDFMIIQQIHHLSARQQFYFFNNKIVLGGLLVWNDGSYIKTWIIQHPHYTALIFFNLTYGDGYTGTFSYKIGIFSSSEWQGPFNNIGEVQKFDWSY